MTLSGAIWFSFELMASPILFKFIVNLLTFKAKFGANLPTLCPIVCASDLKAPVVLATETPALSTVINELSQLQSPVIAWIARLVAKEIAAPISTPKGGGIKTLAAIAAALDAN